MQGESREDGSVDVDKTVSLNLQGCNFREKGSQMSAKTYVNKWADGFVTYFRVVLM